MTISCQTNILSLCAQFRVDCMSVKVLLVAAIRISHVKKATESRSASSLQHKWT